MLRTPLERIAQHPLALVWRIAFHGILLFALPLIVGVLVSMFAEVSEVSETFTGMIQFVSLFLLPILFVQLLGIGIKVRRERRVRLAEGESGARALFASIHRNVRIITGKGMGLFILSLIAVVLALGLEWAQFGVVAVLGLSALYMAIALGVVASALVVTRFEQRLAARGGSLQRNFRPAVIEAGDAIDEEFHLDKVPVPPGFLLRIHQALPARFETESRYVINTNDSRRRLSLTRPIRRTPRGDYHVGPAEIYFTDIFGLTRVSVALTPGASVKVLPRHCPVALGESPRAPSRGEGVLSVLSKHPTEDYVRFRDYVPGDDARRIHWKLSVKVGRMQVRLPETAPVTRRRVRLVLDTFAGMRANQDTGLLDDLLDRLVELWLALARALTERGETVTLLLPTSDPAEPVVEMACRKGGQVRWADLGARAAWQREVDLDELPSAGEQKEQFVIVTARFLALPRLGSHMTWVFIDPAHHIPAEVPGFKRRWRDRVLLPFAAGADENGTMEGLRRRLALRMLERERKALAAAVGGAKSTFLASVQARGDGIYRVSRSGATYLLDGP